MPQRTWREGLHQAILSHDARSLRLTAHTLKGGETFAAKVTR